MEIGNETKVTAIAFSFGDFSAQENSSMLDAIRSCKI